MSGVLPLLVRWARRASTRDFCPGLAALVDPVQNILFLTAHYFTSFILIAQQTRQAVVPSRPSLDMCLWFCKVEFSCYHLEKVDYCNYDLIYNKDKKNFLAAKNIFSKPADNYNSLAGNFEDDNHLNWLLDTIFSSRFPHNLVVCMHFLCHFHPWNNNA
jgi:hypothetical protein